MSTNNRSVVITMRLNVKLENEQLQLKKKNMLVQTER